MRQLPRSLDPLPDESLPGFLLRLSCRLEQAPAEIAAVTGLVPGRIMGSGLLLAIPAAVIGPFSTAARLSPGESRSLTLSSLGGRYPPLDLAAGGRTRQAQGATGLIRWVFTGSSRYCPECLSASGAPAGSLYGGSWRRTWRLPVTVACERHGRLLEHLCPECRAPAHDTARAGLIPRPGDVLHPAQCRAPGPHARKVSSRLRLACGARLDDAAVSSGRRPASRAVLTLQKRLSSMFGLSEAPAEGGYGREEVSRRLQDLRAVGCLITMTWPLARPFMPADPVLAAAFDRHVAGQQEDIEKRRRQGHRVHALALYDTPPLDAAACAGLLLAADALLRTEPARGDIGALVTAAYPASALGTFFEDIRGFCTAGLRDTISAEMSRLHPPDQRGAISHLRKKPAAAKPARDGWTSYHLRHGHLVVRPQGDCRFDHRHVPQHLPGSWAASHFSGADGIYPRHLHITAAVRLVQMSSGGSHAAAGEKLGIPHRTVTAAVHSVRVWTRDLDNSLRFTAAVRAFADQLNASDCLTDYANRRARLAGWIIPPSEWKQAAAQIAAATGLSQARAASERRRRLFSGLAGAAATSGDPLLAPLVLTEPRGAGLLRQDLSQVRYQARARPGQTAASLAMVAQDYGASLGRAADAAAAAHSRLAE